MLESVRYRVTLIKTSFPDVDVIAENYCISSRVPRSSAHIVTSSDTDAPLLAPKRRFV